MRERKDLETRFEREGCAASDEPKNYSAWLLPMRQATARGRLGVNVSVWQHKLSIADRRDAGDARPVDHAGWPGGRIKRGIDVRKSRREKVPTAQRGEKDFAQSGTPSKHKRMRRACLCSTSEVSRETSTACDESEVQKMVGCPPLPWRDAAESRNFEYCCVEESEAALRRVKSSIAAYAGIPRWMHSLTEQSDMSSKHPPSTATGIHEGAQISWEEGCPNSECGGQKLKNTRDSKRATLRRLEQPFVQVKSGATIVRIGEEQSWTENE
ncbi:hypothetical protein FB451DRAFT_1375605 [Mycena latifolia]|nr:hypothetical protein FB451DRAFT_1375605 [Mycena latifolia]